MKVITGVLGLCAALVVAFTLGGTASAAAGCPTNPIQAGKNWAGANLDHCNLAGFNFAGANLKGANLDHANLNGAILDGANLTGAKLDHMSFQGGSAQGANFSGDNLNHANLDGSNLDGADLDGASLDHVSFQNGSAQGASFVGDNLGHSNLAGSNLAYADLTNAKIGSGSCDGTITAGSTGSACGPGAITEFCSAGTWSSTGFPTCTPADPGNYVSGEGATSQTPCSAGTYQPDAGQSSCLTADAGSYVSASGAASESACAIGWYQPDAGQTSCIEAPIGTYVDTAGATQATACPSGKTTSSTGSTSSSDCHGTARIQLSSFSCHPGSFPQYPGQLPDPGQVSFMVSWSGFTGVSPSNPITFTIQQYGYAWNHFTETTDSSTGVYVGFSLNYGHFEMSGLTATTADGQSATPLNYPYGC